MILNWSGLWQSLFGTTELFGLNMGFWVSMGVTALIVLIQNIVFWKCFKPFGTWEHKRETVEE